MTDRVSEIGFSSTYLESAKNGFEARWTRLFFTFGQIFYHIWWLFKVSQFLWHAPLSKNIKYAPQKMKKILVHLALNPFLHCTSRIQNPGFGVYHSNLQIMVYYLVIFHTWYTYIYNTFLNLFCSLFVEKLTMVYVAS